MSDLIRPEALALIARWRGVLIALGLAGLGLWWGLGSGGILAALGWAMVLLAAILLWTEVQRRRFARAADAGDPDPGVVEVTEGQVTYLAARGGGFAALSEVSEILLATRGGDRAWVLRAPGQPDLVIPLGAAGADALFDAFGSLPGLTGAALVQALTVPVDAAARGTVLPMVRPGTPDRRRVWRRPPRLLQ